MRGHDAEGGLDGPLVLVGGYLVVRCVHLVVNAVAAQSDAGLRHRISVSWFWPALGGGLLVAGALLGGWAARALRDGR